MGVSGLWTLLEPVGKRVNIKSLAGKTLAVGMDYMTVLNCPICMPYCD